jgi:hypothetical protein
MERIKCGLSGLLRPNPSLRCLPGAVSRTGIEQHYHYAGSRARTAALSRGTIGRGWGKFCEGPCEASALVTHVLSSANGILTCLTHPWPLSLKRIAAEKESIFLCTEHHLLSDNWNSFIEVAKTKGLTEKQLDRAVRNMQYNASALPHAYHYHHLHSARAFIDIFMHAHTHTHNMPLTYLH